MDLGLVIGIVKPRGWWDRDDGNEDGKLMEDEVDKMMEMHKTTNNTRKSKIIS